MVKITSDQALIASHEAADGINTTFVNRVMSTITSPNKSLTPFAQWRHLHRFAFVLIAVAALAFVSGTAYAAYQLWLKPKVEIQQFGQNQYGRNEALATFQNCKENAGTSYEVKSSSQLNAEELGQLLRARCEMDAITAWAAATSGTDNITSMLMLYPSALTVTSINGNTYELHGTQGDKTVNITEDTTFIVHGLKVARDAIHVGDTVAYVEKNTYAHNGNWPTERRPIAIVALELPAKFYENNLQNQVAKRKSCYGNPSDTCVDSGSIDVYPRNGENNSAPTEPGDHFVIQGRIVEHNDATIKIKGSSGAIYTITTPLDMIADFNNRYSQNYDGTTIQIGDMLMVNYNQPADADHKVIQPGRVQSVVLMIEVVRKTDGIKKY